MGIVKFIEDARGTVMSTGEFISFVSDVHEESGNYVLAAMYLESTPATVRRVVKGRDSDVLRKALDIKKGDRMRQCFECTLETRDNIKLLRGETGLPGKELLEEMVDVYLEYLSIRDNIKLLREETGLPRDELLEEMIDVYLEYLLIAA